MASGYNMKIPQELADFFQNYIDEHKELGYKFISQYILHILQDHAKELLSLSTISKEKKERTINLNSGTYTKEQLQKLLKNMEE